MNIQSMIEVINQYIRDTRLLRGINNNSFIVAHKMVSSASESFKAMKNYTVFIKLVDNKNTIDLYKCDKTFNSNLVDSNEAFDVISKDLLMSLLKSTSDGSLDNVINGTININNYETT